MTPLRPATVEVDLDAVRANVAALARVAAPAALLAVVKADAYGHGAVPVARATLDAGAAWLGVATVEEGLELRDAGITAPVLVIAPPSPAAAPAVVGADLAVVVDGPESVDAVAAAARAAGRRGHPVHLKVDTGMHRVGCDPDDAPALAAAIDGRAELALDGLMTHLAVADEPDRTETGDQLDRFDAVVARLADAGYAPRWVHAANTAATIGVPRARFDLVRCGIGCYGISPAPPFSAGPAPGVRWAPALRWRAEVVRTRDLPAGAAVSYGLRRRLDRAARIAVVPVGYADGVPRALGSHGGAVLVGGRRCPIAGTVTMDQILVDCGDLDVAVGDEVVLLGGQGDEEVTPAEWADRVGTIAYEIVTRIGPRVPRVHRGDGHGPTAPGEPCAAT